MCRAVTLLFILGVSFAFLNPPVIPQFHKLQGIDRILINIHDDTPADGWPNVAYQIKDTPKPSPFWNYRKEIQDPDTITQFKNALGVTWDGFFPLHSYETGSRYQVEIYSGTTLQETLFFSDTEWGNAGRPPQALLTFIKNKQANESMNRISMPAALLACRLLGSLRCQKQVGIGHRGR